VSQLDGTGPDHLWQPCPRRVHRRRCGRPEDRQASRTRRRSPIGTSVRACSPAGGVGAGDPDGHTIHGNSSRRADPSDFLGGRGISAARCPTADGHTCEHHAHLPGRPVSHHRAQHPVRTDGYRPPLTAMEPPRGTLLASAHPNARLPSAFFARMSASSAPSSGTPGYAATDSALPGSPN